MAFPHLPRGALVPHSPRGGVCGGLLLLLGKAGPSLGTSWEDAEINLLSHLPLFPPVASPLWQFSPAACHMLS